MFVFLASQSCERICERLSRKREPLYLDLGIEIEAADSSQHRRLVVEYAQQLPVLGHHMGAGPTYGPQGNRCVQRCPRCLGVHASSSCKHFTDNLAFNQAPQRRFREDFISTWSLGLTLAFVKETTSVGVTACSRPSRKDGCTGHKSGWCREEE